MTTTTARHTAPAFAVRRPDGTRATVCRACLAAELESGATAVDTRTGRTVRPAYPLPTTSRSEITS